MGVPQENKSMTACQVMTCAADYSVLFWDTRPPKGPGQLNFGAKNEKNDKTQIGVPSTFKHLDLSWKPMLKVSYRKSFNFLQSNFFNFVIYAIMTAVSGYEYQK